MNKEDQLIQMMIYVHGELENPGKCHYEAYQYDDGWVVWLVKNGDRCWSVIDQDLLFDYTLKRLPIPVPPPKIEG